MERYVDWVRFGSLVSHALASGATITPTSVKWDISMGCSNPYSFTLVSGKPLPHQMVYPRAAPAHWPTAVKFYPRLGSRVYITEDRKRWLDIDSPCRRCEQCCLNRSRLWTKRARIEISLWPRTWFGTLTVNPSWRFKLSLRSGSRNYHDSYREISKELTKYFKRLRKQGFKFRYLSAAEAHKDGYPHLHVLIHEGFTAIPKRTLQEEWHLGFSSFKLVQDDVNAARYVTKYLNKDNRSRVRASQKYGMSMADFTLGALSP